LRNPLDFIAVAEFLAEQAGDIIGAVAFTSVEIVVSSQVFPERISSLVAESLQACRFLQ